MARELLESAESPLPSRQATVRGRVSCCTAACDRCHRLCRGVECLCVQPEELAYITTNIAGLTTDRVRWLVATLTQSVDAAASVVDHDVFRAVRDQTIREWVESTGFVFDDVQVSDAEPLLSLAHCLTVVVLSQLQGRLGTTTVANRSRFGLGSGARRRVYLWHVVVTASCAAPTRH